VCEAVESLALGQCEGLAHPGSGDRGPGDQVLALLDSEVQDHRAGFGVDIEENRTGTPIANLLQGRAFGEIGDLLLQDLRGMGPVDSLPALVKPHSVVT